MTLTPERRVAGVLVPVFALRSEGDLGIGDTDSLRRFIDWAADSGFGVVQILPINETGGDNSPYNAISSMALDPTTLHLAPGSPPELSAEDYAESLAKVDLAALRVGPVQYSQVKPLKRDLLESAFAAFARGHDGQSFSPRQQAFVDFTQAQRGWLPDYALFRALMERNGGTECWDRWLPGQGTAEEAWHWAGALPPAQAAALRQRMEFHSFVQWVAYEQWEEVKRHAGRRGVALMGDIPFGVSYYSADVFSRPGDFRLAWSGGAPPEPYFKDDPFTQKWGQNWGIPLYDWARMREDDYAWWRQRVDGVRNVFHVFRIDHILGFYRIYGFPWRPDRNAEFLPLSPGQARERTGGPLPGFQPRDDDNAENWDANRREGEAYLRMVLEAAGDTVLVGEDLGTVPPYVRPSLTALGIAGFKIPIWEPDPATGYRRLIRPEHYGRLSLATFATHDHEPLVALWERWEKAIRAPGGGPDAHGAWEEMHRLADFADLPDDLRGVGWGPEVHARLLEALFRTESWIAVAMITDLFGTAERFNVPGTATESNWSQRLGLSVEELRTEPATVALTERVRGMIQRTGRAVA